MMKLLTYLEKRRIGLHPQQNDLSIQGINASEQQLLIACQSLDRKSALSIFCRNHPYGHILNEQGKILIDYILPEPIVLEEWLQIVALVCIHWHLMNFQ